MKDFTDIFFKGKFRKYQQRVLDNSENFLKDKKINIVAAPGSGKTILGLELIRRLGSACLIFSPTTTIRDQWGERFKDSFLNDSSMIKDYFSNDLNEIKLINSITYQALYSAIKKISASSEDEEIDYSNIDLFKILKEKNIKTICLDEAHHLKNEWQKALEVFIKEIAKEIIVISLTATPPYDSKSTEWNRYITTCGEIDDEIFVPELVKEKTLCPHQDYIIFNYPSKEETDSFQAHRNECYIALDEIFGLPFINDLSNRISYLYKNNIDHVYSNFKYVVAVMILLDAADANPNKRIFYKLTNAKVFPKLDNKFAERALQFLLEDEYLLNADEQEMILKILKKHSMLERKKVLIDLNDKLKRNLISSSGKLNSISLIYKSEKESLQDNLRMLILTDYIKKETLSAVGTDAQFSNISVISIFEELRRKYNDIKLAVLSGSLVILNNSIISELENYSIKEDFYNTQEIKNTDYSIVTFKGNNKEKVSIVSKMFEDGLIECLIGTQALLGEGWDSPCINSLILASYVWSFMLSNQMRGRAIRVDRNNPNKVSNIWHLVTIEPDYVFEDNAVKRLIAKLNTDKKHITSCDYQTLVRRFDCFVGPNYDSGEIESSFDRITFIKPPYDKKHLDEINDQMFEKSKKRDITSKEWNDNLTNEGRIFIETKVPREFRTNPFNYYNMIGLVIFTAMQTAIIQMLRMFTQLSIPKEFTILSLIALIATLFTLLTFSFKIIFFVVKHSSPIKSITNISKAILSTLKKLDLVDNDAVLDVTSDDLNLSINVGIKNDSLKGQNIFNEAIKELLLPIDNPRYVIIKLNIFNKYDYRYSFACPKVIYDKKDGIETLNKELNKQFGKMKAVYVYYDVGRGILRKCKKKAFITENENLMKKKQKISKFE